MKRILLGIGATAAVLLSASAAPHAQEPQTEVPPAPASGWVFIPGVTLGAMYDSNVLVTTSVLPSTGKPPTDTVYTIDPNGKLRYHGKRNSFSGSYHGQFHLYNTFDSLNRVAQGADVSFDRRATKRLTLGAQNLYEFSPTTDDVNLWGAPFTRAGVHTDRLSATAGYRLSEFTDSTVRYNFTSAQFDRQAPELTSGIVHEVHFDTTHRFTGRLRAGGEGDLRRANMDSAGGRELWFLDVGGIVGYAIGEFTNMSVSGGVSRMSDNLRNITRTGPYVRASISHLTERASVGGSYERSFVPSFGFGGATRSQQVRGWIDLPPIGRRVYISGTAHWRQTNPFEPLAVKRDTYQLRTTVGYAIARTIRAQAFYAFTSSTAVVTEINVTRHRAGGELVLFQPMRIR